VNTYFAYPKDKKTDVAILMLSDIFGLPLVNNPLMADTLAAAGYFVVLPDLFYGNAVGVNDLNDPSFNISAWLLTHPESETQGVINATINTMKTSYGVEKVGGSGFCFGGKFVIDYLASGDITLDAGYVAHPSGALPADYQTVSRPLSIAWGELDTSNPSDSRAAAELTLTTIDANYQTSLYADVEHGFSTRTNLTNPRNQFAQESAFLQNIRWFDVWLK
ncbi:dienelactone hydrolase, partial [Calycina marina]